MEGDIEKAAGLMNDSETIVAFTGAGVSTESGIPDFRSPGGIWDKYDPDDFTYQNFMNDPENYWRKRLEMRRERDFDFSEVEPNPAHEAIAELEEIGKLSTVITQNVDNLHQDAGNSNVIELHGNNRKVKCLECGTVYSADLAWEKAETGELPPTCDCGGVLKTETVLFGESLPRKALTRARTGAENCDMMLAVGSSLVVQPAANIPKIAKRNGAHLCIVNLESTPLDTAADVVIQEKAGQVLPQIVEKMKNKEN